MISLCEEVEEAEAAEAALTARRAADCTGGYTGAGVTDDAGAGGPRPAGGGEPGSPGIVASALGGGSGTRIIPRSASRLYIVLFFLTLAIRRK